MHDSKFLRLLILSIAITGLPTTAIAHQIQNGSFESGINPPAPPPPTRVTADPGLPSHQSGKTPSGMPLTLFLPPWWNRPIPEDHASHATPRHGSGGAAVPKLMMPTRPRTSRGGGGAGAGGGGGNPSGEAGDSMQAFEETVEPAFPAWMTQLEDETSGHSETSGAWLEEPSTNRLSARSLDGLRGIAARRSHGIHSDTGIILEKAPVWVSSFARNASELSRGVDIADSPIDDSTDGDLPPVYENPAPGGIILGMMAVLAAGIHRRVRSSRESEELL